MMKKLIILVFILFCFVSLNYVSAANVGGALTQGKGKFSVGIDGEYVFNRETKREGFDSHEIVNAVTFSFDTRITLENLYRGMVKLSYGVLDNLDIYASVGESGFNYGRWDLMDGIGNFGPIIPMAGYAKLTGQNAPVYAAGIKGTYPIFQSWLIGCDAKYLWQRNSYKGSGELIGPNIGGPGINAMRMRWGGKMTIEEWHIAPYIAKKFATDRFGMFTPYVGARYSNFRLRDVVTKLDPGDASVILQTRRYPSNDHTGAFCGLDYNLGSHLSLNVEGRFIDETAASASLAYKF